MIEGILYTCLFFGLIGTLGFMYALHREIKEDEREYKDRFLDDMWCQTNSRAQLCSSSAHFRA